MSTLARTTAVLVVSAHFVACGPDSPQPVQPGESEIADAVGPSGGPLIVLAPAAPGERPERSVRVHAGEGLLVVADQPLESAREAEPSGAIAPILHDASLWVVARASGRTRLALFSPNREGAFAEIDITVLPRRVPIAPERAAPLVDPISIRFGGSESVADPMFLRRSSLSIVSLEDAAEVVSTADPEIVDLVVNSTREIQLVPKAIGVTTLAIETMDGVRHVSTVTVLDDLHFEPRRGGFLEANTLPVPDEGEPLAESKVDIDTGRKRLAIPDATYRMSIGDPCVVDIDIDALSKEGSALLVDLVPIRAGRTRLIVWGAEHRIRNVVDLRVPTGAAVEPPADGTQCGRSAATNRAGSLGVARRL